MIALWKTRTANSKIDLCICKSSFVTEISFDHYIIEHSIHKKMGRSSRRCMRRAKKKGVILL